MLADFQKGIKFNLLITAFRRSPFVVHGFPFITTTGRRSVETNVGFHRDGESSSILGIGTSVLTGTDAAVIQRTTEFGMLPAEIIAIGFHSETLGTDRDTVRANRDTLVIGDILGPAEVEINERNDRFPLAELVHSHGVMSRIQQ